MKRTASFRHLTWVGLFVGSAALGASPAKTNKLLGMYQLFYLPFPVEFRVGRTVDTVLPYLPDGQGQLQRLVEARELVELDSDWTKIRSEWRNKSLLEFNKVPVGQSVRISPKLASHRLSVKHRAWDTLPLSEKASLAQTLKGKPAALIAAFYQLRLLKTLMAPADEQKFNFFVVSASWCESSREYRVLLETYFKKFPNPELVLHSVVIDDPQQTVFDSQLLKELFPSPKRYSHETIPRFLAMETVDGKPKIWEEGDALIQLYERFYADKRGFLADKTSALSPRQKARGSSLSPALSAARP